jgi:hypothetical protein
MAQPEGFPNAQSCGENPTGGMDRRKELCRVKLGRRGSRVSGAVLLASIGWIAVVFGCTRTANPDRAPNQISNNTPRADAAYTNQSVPTNQLQTNR